MRSGLGYQLRAEESNSCYELLMRAWQKLVFAFAVVLTIASCASPTLPLPPPDAPSISESSAGVYHLSSTGGAEPNAVIVIVNRNTSLALDKRVSGSIADAHGSWDADVIASPGDVLDITQEFDNTDSPSTTITLPQ